MEEITLIIPAAEYAGQIEEYRAEFCEEQRNTVYIPGRVPGMDGREKFDDVYEWLRFCREMEGKISWFMSLRQSDGRIIGFCCLRHKLEYDDDDIAFASHIGYSVRPSEQGKGYGSRQLELILQKAHEYGINPARVICRSDNRASIHTILSNGGIYVDSIYGEESGATVNRYDIPAAGHRNS